MIEAVFVGVYVCVCVVSGGETCVVTVAGRLPQQFQICCFTTES